MTHSKAEIRRLVRDAEQLMSASRKERSDEALTERFLALPAFKAAKTVLLYWGVGTEIDTAPIVRASLAAGKRVALPRIVSRGVMEARQIRDAGELVPGAFGIPEPPAECALVAPEEPELILVPGTAFTPDGKRLGKGGGYYDRYLPRTRGLRAALARKLQIFEDLPVDPHDARIDILIRE